MKLETVEDFNKVKSFIDQLKSERKAFFGDRETPGTSRYEVPRMRDAMYAAEEAGDFSEATEQCLWLTNKIRYRMLFIEDMTDRIGNFSGTL